MPSGKELAISPLQTTRIYASLDSPIELPRFLIETFSLVHYVTSHDSDES
jgi:hypothetical protein